MPEDPGRYKAAGVDVDQAVAAGATAELRLRPQVSRPVPCGPLTVRVIEEACHLRCTGF
jgi:hypothetical protein